MKNAVRLALLGALLGAGRLHAQLPPPVAPAPDARARAQAAARQLGAALHLLPHQLQAVYASALAYERAADSLARRPAAPAPCADSARHRVRARYVVALRHTLSVAQLEAATRQGLALEGPRP